MKALIHYVKGHKLSEEMARESLESYKKYNWGAQLIEGYTPDTLPPEILDYMTIPDGRLMNLNNAKVFRTKLAIAMNQIRFWSIVLSKNETMAFVEHDSIACGPYQHYNFSDLLLINMDEETIEDQMKHIFCRSEYFDYKLPKSNNLVNSLPKDWPWTYEFDNAYKDSKLPPGTSAYVLTPKGAARLLSAAQRFGIDQGDMMINTFNVDIKYSTKKMAKYNKKFTETKSLNGDYK